MLRGAEKSPHMAAQVPVPVSAGYTASPSCLLTEEGGREAPKQVGLGMRKGPGGGGRDLLLRVIPQLHTSSRPAWATRDPASNEMKHKEQRGFLLIDLEAKGAPLTRASEYIRRAVERPQVLS